MNSLINTRQEVASSMGVAKHSRESLAIALRKICEGRASLVRAHQHNPYLREGVAIEWDDSDLIQICESLRTSIIELEEYIAECQAELEEDDFDAT